MRSGWRLSARLSMFRSLIQLEYRHELRKSICMHICGYIAVLFIIRQVYLSLIMLALVGFTVAAA